MSNAGILHDTAIKSLAKESKLIRTNFKESCVRHASYQARIGLYVERLTHDQGKDTWGYHDVFPEGPAKIGDIVQIKPGDTLKLYTLEEIDIPSDVSVIAIAVGRLFEIGLIPETTFADPGFDGTLHVIVSNYSRRVAELAIGDPLCRLQFTRLPIPVNTEHKGRSHIEHPKRWPKAPKRATLESLQSMSRAQLIEQIIAEWETPHYEHAFVTQAIDSSVSSIERDLSVTRLVFYIILFLLLECIAFVSSELNEHVNRLIILAPIFLAAISLFIRFVRADVSNSVRRLFEIVKI